MSKCPTAIHPNMFGAFKTSLLSSRAPLCDVVWHSRRAVRHLVCLYQRLGQGNHFLERTLNIKPLNGEFSICISFFAITLSPACAVLIVWNINFPSPVPVWHCSIRCLNLPKKKKRKEKNEKKKKEIKNVLCTYSFSWMWEFLPQSF